MMSRTGQHTETGMNGAPEVTGESLSGAANLKSITKARDVLLSFEPEPLIAFREDPKLRHAFLDENGGPGGIELAGSSRIRRAQACEQARRDLVDAVLDPNTSEAALKGLLDVLQTPARKGAPAPDFELIENKVAMIGRFRQISDERVSVALESVDLRGGLLDLVVSGDRSIGREAANVFAVAGLTSDEIKSLKRDASRLTQTLAPDATKPPHQLDNILLALRGESNQVTLNQIAALTDDRYKDVVALARFALRSAEDLRRE